MPDRYAPQMHFQNSTVRGEEHGAGTRHLRCSRLLQPPQRLKTVPQTDKLPQTCWGLTVLAPRAEGRSHKKSLCFIFPCEMDLLMHAVCPNTAVTPQQGARLSSTKTKPRSLSDFCIVALSFYQRQSLS